MCNQSFSFILWKIERESKSKGEELGKIGEWEKDWSRQMNIETQERKRNWVKERQLEGYIQIAPDSNKRERGQRGAHDTGTV